jgi:hypothetical protein
VGFYHGDCHSRFRGPSAQAAASGDRIAKTRLRLDCLLDDRDLLVGEPVELVDDVVEFLPSWTSQTRKQR